MKLQAGDILVCVNGKHNIVSSIKRWAIGPYSHVFMYLGNMGVLVHSTLLRHTMLFESNGRGVVLRSLSSRYGEEVVVMRLKAQHPLEMIKVIEEAIMLASDPQSSYDYFAVMCYILPRILHEKLGMPLPLAWQRDARQICSEAVYEVFRRAGLDLLPYWGVPLPGDFVTYSAMLEEVHRGTLDSTWV